MLFSGVTVLLLGVNRFPKQNKRVPSPRTDPGPILLWFLGTILGDQIY